MTAGNIPQQGLPEWLLLILAVWFFAGSFLYLYRLLFAKQVRAVYGYWDMENEIGHGICMLAMVTMLAPMLLPIPLFIWSWVLGAGSVWFLARAVSWGRRLSYPTKWWWDWAHVGMLAGMSAMFAGVAFSLFSLVAGAFWLWLAGYYAYETYHDAKAGKPLYIASDLAHMSMGIVMFMMTVAPCLFMGNMPM